MGRTPWSARVPLDPLFSLRSGPARGSAHQLIYCPSMRPIFLLLASSALWAQPATPAFEVASVKPLVLAPNQFAFATVAGAGLRISGNRVTTQGTLLGLVAAAYNVKDFQISGAPKWTDSRNREQLYDIAAKTEGEGTPSMAQVRLMLQTLLADRFQLKLHGEPKVMPVYDLTVDRNGPKMKPSAPDAATHTESLSAPLGLYGAKYSNLSLDQLVVRISPNFDRPLLDKTGLRGGYDFTLQYTLSNRDLVAADSPATDRPIFLELQQQLGLKVVPAKEPVECLLIDHAGKPSEN